MGIGILASYPFLMTVGTMGVGENYGAPSANRSAAYLYPTFASLAAVGASAAAGAAAFSYGSEVEDAAFGIFLGVLPNAFLNAYVYNRVKKPATDDMSSRLSVAPYVASYRVGRSEPTPVYGLSFSF